MPDKPYKPKKPVIWHYKPKPKMGTYKHNTLTELKWRTDAEILTPIRYDPTKVKPKAAVVKTKVSPETKALLDKKVAEAGEARRSGKPLGMVAKTKKRLGFPGTAEKHAHPNADRALDHLKRNVGKYLDKPDILRRIKGIGIVGRRCGGANLTGVRISASVLHLSSVRVLCL